MKKWLYYGYKDYDSQMVGWNKKQRAKEMKKKMKI